MARPGLDAHLADPGRAGAVQHADVLVEVGAQLLFGRVALPHLADLASNRDGHALLLQVADQAGQLGRVAGVDPLLLANGGPRQVDEGAAVDVDVLESGAERLAGQVVQAGHLRIRISLPLSGVELEVVALQEDRPAPAGPDRRGQDDRGVLAGSLVGVGHLALGNLEDHAAGVARQRFGEGLPSRQVGRCPDVDGRDREACRLELAAAARHVQLVNRGRWASERLARLPDQPARGVAQPGIRIEDCLEDQRVDDVGAEARRLGDGELPAVQAGSGQDEIGQLLGRGDGHGSHASEARRRG